MRTALLLLWLVGTTQAASGQVFDPNVRPASDAAPGNYVVIERGEERPVIDGVGRVLGIPSKLLLWDRRVANHDVSEETVNKAVGYLQDSDVPDGMIRVNQYAPLAEWQRLRDNDNIRPGWKYTMGSLYTLGYTVIPGRLFGGDWYNPYTNSVHLYSDVPALAMEQAAYAEDVNRREKPGRYAAVQSLPFAGLWHETQNKHAVFNYLEATGAPAEEKAEAKRVLYPQLGTEFGGQIGGLVPQVEIIPQAAGAAVGHLIGRRRAAAETAQP